MICGSCRGVMPSGAKYCTACGSPMATGDEIRGISAGVPPDIPPNPEIIPVQDMAPAPEDAPSHEPVPEEIPEKGANSRKPRVYVDTFVPPSESQSLRNEPDGDTPYGADRTHFNGGQQAYGPRIYVNGELISGGKTESSEPMFKAAQEYSAIFHRDDTTAAGSGSETKLTAGQFFIMELLALIPLAGLIIMCVWAFAGGVNANRAAFAQSKLIMMLITTFSLCAAFVILLVLVSNNMITLKWLTLG